MMHFGCKMLKDTVLVDIKLTHHDTLSNRVGEQKFFHRGFLGGWEKFQRGSSVGIFLARIPRSMRKKPPRKSCWWNFSCFTCLKSCCLESTEDSQFPSEDVVLSNTIIWSHDIFSHFRHSTNEAVQFFSEEVVLKEKMLPREYLLSHRGVHADRNF